MTPTNVTKQKKLEELAQVLGLKQRSQAMLTTVFETGMLDDSLKATLTPEALVAEATLPYYDSKMSLAELEGVLSFYRSPFGRAALSLFSVESEEAIKNWLRSKVEAWISTQTTPGSALAEALEKK